MLSARRAASLLLLILSLFFLLTGFGITETGIVGPLTFGLLGKALSFQIHSLLWGPFLAVLGLHVYLSCRAGRR
jgi:hypothetical protein